MNFQFYVEKLFASDYFQAFKSEHKDAYPCSAFFVIDKKEKDAKQHFDFWLPKEKKMFSIKLEDNGEAIPVELIDETVPKEIALNLTFDFDDVEAAIKERMKHENIKNELQKMLFSLQKKEGEHYLVGTVFISMMGMLKVSYNIDKKHLVDFEKKSFFDIMKVKKK